MNAFETEIAKIVAAQELIWRARTAVGSRQQAIAKVWAMRPGGFEWSDLLKAVNASLPPGAWLTYSTARSDESVARSR